MAMMRSLIPPTAKPPLAVPGQHQIEGSIAQFAVDAVAIDVRDAW